MTPEQCHQCLTQYHHALCQAADVRAAKSGFEPLWKFFGLPRKGGLAKNLYTKSERLTLSCRVTWAWYERVTLYNRPIIILPRKKERKNSMQWTWVPGPLLDCQAPIIWTGFIPIPLVLADLVSTHQGGRREGNSETGHTSTSPQEVKQPVPHKVYRSTSILITWTNYKHALPGGLLFTVMAIKLMQVPHGFCAFTLQLAQS
jgi:hypothetical protein